MKKICADQFKAGMWIKEPTGYFTLIKRLTANHIVLYREVKLPIRIEGKVVKYWTV